MDLHNCRHDRLFREDKREVERLHKKKDLNFKEIDFMIKYYKNL